MARVIDIGLVIPEIVVRAIPLIVAWTLQRVVWLPGRLGLELQVMAGQPVDIGRVIPEVVEVPRGFAFNHIEMLAPVPGQMGGRLQSGRSLEERAPAPSQP